MSLHEASPPKNIVLVGPTNVGKSALFNRLTKTRAAIVCDRPGVTVDRHELLVEDSPAGPVFIVDTGGVGPRAMEHPLGAEINRAATEAVKSADIILFVVDGTRDVGTEELEIAQWLRSQSGVVDNKVIWLVANKSDAKKHDSSSYYALGFEKLFDVSAAHDEGFLDLWDAITARISPSATAAVVAPENLVKAKRVLVLGRPNVGKSTLLNSILGRERHVVSEVAGTTRDPIETEYQSRGGFTWKLCDTAGIRQPGRLERDVEWVAREKIKDLARTADLAVIVLDASQAISDLDAAIAGMAIDFGLSVVLALNKWDKMHGEDAEDLWTKLERTGDLKLEFLKWCPRVKISGLTGRGIPELLKVMGRVLTSRHVRVQTSKLNAIFEKRIRLHSHPLGPRAKPAKFYFLSQVGVDPPEFVIFSNIPAPAVHFSYKRFIVNTLRGEFGFEGTPVKLHFKTTHASNS